MVTSSARQEIASLTACQLKVHPLPAVTASGVIVGGRRPPISWPTRCRYGRC